jgi:hypothetical protein
MVEQLCEANAVKASKETGDQTHTHDGHCHAEYPRPISGLQPPKFVGNHARYQNTGGRYRRNGPPAETGLDPSTPPKSAYNPL